MPTANIRGAHINYKVLGDHGPWVALSPGGRRDMSGIELLAGEVANQGYRVVIFDRRNCGASDVSRGRQLVGLPHFDPIRAPPS